MKRITIGLYVLLTFIFLSCSDENEQIQLSEKQMTIYELITAKWDLIGINEFGMTRKPKSSSFVEFNKNWQYSFRNEYERRNGIWSISEDGRKIYLDSGRAKEMVLNLNELNLENLRLSYIYQGRDVDLRFEQSVRK